MNSLEYEMTLMIQHCEWREIGTKLCLIFGEIPFCITVLHLGTGRERMGYERARAHILHLLKGRRSL